MKKLITLFAIVFACSISCNAQSAASTNDVPIEQKRLDALKGTYALENLNPRFPASVPSDLAAIIEKNRKDNEETRLRLNENIVLVIYPRNKISNSAVPEKRD